MTEVAVQKVLTKNDTSETGAHQAGICIPKDKVILSFFPVLDGNTKNPRTVILVVDDADKEWCFPFIYYNNKKFGGTRNEYRLTGMTRFLKTYNLKAGDTITLKHDGPKKLRIKFKRASDQSTCLKLSTSWKIIEVEDYK